MMRKRVVQKIILGMSLAWPLASVNAQQALPSAATTITGRAPLAATAPTSVPALVPFSSAAVDGKGKPLAGETSATFLIYKDQQGGEPLFSESQIVSFDELGRYKVQLGAANPNGLPSELFSTGEARWLEVQIAGQPAEARVLLASVPYALKAADAATLGGLPASAFALAGSNAAVVNAAPAAISPDGATAVTTTGGTTNKLAKFSGANTIVNSILYDNGTDVGIGTTTPTATLDVNGAAVVSGALSVTGTSTFAGPVVLPPTAMATSSKDYSSQYLKFETSTYNSSSSSVVEPRFQLQAEPHANNTANPTATLNLISSTTNNAPTETGFSFNANGTINFAPGQTFGATSAAGVAVNGTSTSNTGVAGTSASGDGIYGITNDTTSTDNTAGVYGYSSSKPGIKGHSTNASGVVGVSGTDSANIGLSGDAAGVYGYSGSSITGVKGSSASGTGVQGTSSSGSGVVGANANTGIGTAGVLGIAGERNTSGYTGIAGVWGDSSASVGVYGSSDQYSGVSGQSAYGNGVYGVSLSGAGGNFVSTQSFGVNTQGGQDSTGLGWEGIVARGGDGDQGTYYTSPGGAGGNFSGGDATVDANGGSGGYGIFAQGGANNDDAGDSAPAGYFYGDVEVVGHITADDLNVKIDHPNDPANKYLVHASIESSEMVNIYSGNVVTDELGLATVQLPSWFEVLNGDLRYQLTVVGRKAQAWISEEVKEGKFQIASDATNTKVSWQITGVRQDAYAKAHPLVVEEVKDARERGFYKHPELYGQPAEKQIEWGRNPQMMQRIKAAREAQKQRSAVVRARAAVAANAIDGARPTSLATAAAKTAGTTP